MSLQKSFEVVQHAQRGESVALSYDQRLLRRKKLTMVSGEAFYVDLPQTISVMAGQGFLLEDGRVVRIEAADEDLLAITGPDMLRYAWHIGNRHSPCELAADQLVIQRDPVIKAMLTQLGAEVRDICTAFTPEGGAYGHGRTMGHDHGPAHSHDHSHDHNHDGHDHNYDKDHRLDQSHAPHGHSHD
ncbi:urease accessory protein UreE [Pacificibacter sp. AS14]|uniref:urease accessory protein UreE n=1 Tax=Pacificibacter sp. AS14 TaxID=3135785 RepID=UPI0031745C47